MQAQNYGPLAFALAGLARARLTVAWVTDPLLAQAAAVYVLDPHGEQARADLREFVAATLPLGAPWLPEPQLVLTVGKPEEEILKIAREQSSDLIVMGMHGLSGYQNVNYVTSHDGFTLYDLVAYNERRNWANG